jgi:type II secretory pathway pseudopilin PulG
MKTKPILTITITLVIGIVLGVIGSRFQARMEAYANVATNAAQGRGIMQEIEAYQDANGFPPDQQWFSSLDYLTTTSEGFQWVYLNPPLVLPDNSKVVILTATNDNSDYLCGILDYGVVFRKINQTKKANKAEMATPRKPSD